MSFNEWKHVGLGEIADFKTGRLNSNAAEINGIYPFFTCSPETFRINSYAFDCEAVILAGNNANGVFALKYYKGKFNAYQRTYVITTNPAEVNIKFVYYQMGLQLQGLENISHGTATKYLTLPLLNEIKINLPPLPTQRRIADILSALDEKIELNRQTNATLEAMAHAIFKEWFIVWNYDLNDSMKTMIGENHSPSGNQKNHGADSPLPQGWRMGSILEIADLLSGGTPSTQVSEYWDGQIKWVSAKDVSNAQGTFVLDTERKVSQIGVKNSSTKFLPALTTIVTARGTVGSYCILAEPMTINQSNYGLKAKKENADYFVFFSLGNLVTHLRQVAYGTIFDTVTTKTFEQTKIIIPPISLIQEFDSKITPIMQNILNNLEETATLASLRDALLPKLMGGEINVLNHD